MKDLVLLLCIVFLLPPATSASSSKIIKETLQSQGHERTFYLYVPEMVLTQKQPAPLLVLLHGSGSKGSKMVELWKKMADDQGIILAGPDSLDGEHWNIPEDAPEFLHDVVESIKSKYPVNARRVYLLGHSAGANGSIPISLFESEYFAATVVSAGALRPERYGLTDYATRKIPFAIFVGTKDPFYSLTTIRATRDALLARGFPVELTEIPDHDHNYAARAKLINRAAWEFFQRHELTTAQLYKPYSFKTEPAQRELSSVTRPPEVTQPSATPAGVSRGSQTVIAPPPPPRRANSIGTAPRPDNPPPTAKPRPSDAATVEPDDDPTPSVNPKPVPSRDEPQDVDENDVVRIKTSLVTVPVRVTDGKGRSVVNLQQQDFHVYENGIEQELSYFSPADLAPSDKPFTVALLLDMSDSAQFQVEDIQDAAIAFVDQLQPDDRVMVLSFDREVHLLAPATTDRQVLHAAIRSAQLGQGTSVYNAIAMVLNQLLNELSGRKAIVLFSDGIDTTSLGADSVSTIKDAERSGALVYAIQYDTVNDFSKLRSAVQRQNPVSQNRSASVRPGRSTRKDWNNAGIYLRLITHNTGGNFYYSDSLEDLAKTFTRIAESLRQQYILGYYPRTQPQPGEQREIKVNVNQSDLRVRARKKYRPQSGQ